MFAACCKYSDNLLNILCMSLVFFEEVEKEKRKTTVLYVQCFPLCTPSGTRTLDPLIKSQLLYQLS